VHGRDAARRAEETEQQAERFLAWLRRRMQRSGGVLLVDPLDPRQIVRWREEWLQEEEEEKEKEEKKKVDGGDGDEAV
jgi:hypothetical protein